MTTTLYHINSNLVGLFRNCRDLFFLGARSWMRRVGHPSRQHFSGLHNLLRRGTHLFGAIKDILGARSDLPLSHQYSLIPRRLVMMLLCLYTPLPSSALLLRHEFSNRMKTQQLNHLGLRNLAPRRISRAPIGRRGRDGDWSWRQWAGGGQHDRNRLLGFFRENRYQCQSCHHLRCHNHKLWGYSPPRRSASSSRSARARDGATASNCNHSLCSLTSLSGSKDKDDQGVDADGSSINSHPHGRIKKVAILGGGLAGLSVAFHLLELSQMQRQEKNAANGTGPPNRNFNWDQLQITIYDKQKVGEGGASSVAGGLLHPFSPRGKLIYLGLPALQQSNHLIDLASKHQPNCILRDRLYRLALSDTNVKQLQATVETLSDECHVDHGDNDFRSQAQIITRNDRENKDNSKPKETSIHGDISQSALPLDQNNAPVYSTKKLLATWRNSEEIYEICQANSMGGLELSNGCKVVDVPLYLRGLWEYCQTMDDNVQNSIENSDEGNNTGNVRWEQITIDSQNQPGDGNVDDINNNDQKLNEELMDYDTVILAAGAGLFQDNILPQRCRHEESTKKGDITSDKQNNDKDEEELCLPIQLVRGQSIEMLMPLPNNATAFINSNPAETASINETKSKAVVDKKTQRNKNSLQEAILCGKYIFPSSSLVTKQPGQRYVIGATHEYQSTPLNHSEIYDNLRARTYDLAPALWDVGQVDRITSGVRVQSMRGGKGRLPIIGKIDLSRQKRLVREGVVSENIDEKPDDTNRNSNRERDSPAAMQGICHPNTWIFTGLSSRGLIYHSLFGKWLAEAVYFDDEELIRERCQEFDWWKKHATNRG